MNSRALENIAVDSVDMKFLPLWSSHASGETKDKQELYEF